jgi:hypothetical protein
MGLFYLTNRQFADKTVNSKSYRILERHETYRTSIRYVVIQLDNFEKDISFPNNSMADLNNSNLVTLKLIKGYWGPEIIEKAKLTHD